MEVTHHDQLDKLDRYVKNDDAYSELHSAWITGNLEHLQNAFPDLKILGLGHESLVIVDPEDSESVLSFPREASTHVPKGVMPFAETYNIHRFLSLLYPENFPDLKKIQGLSRRYTKRERVVSFNKDTQDDPATVGDMLNQELKKMGSTAWIDVMSKKNLFADKKGNIKYVDLVVGGADDFEYLKMNVVKDNIDERYSEDSLSIREKKYSQLLTYLRRLAELRLVNRIFEEALNQKFSDQYDFRAEIEKFVFLGDESEVAKKDVLSRKRISILLDKAVEAVKSGKYTYLDGRWTENK